MWGDATTTKRREFTFDNGKQIFRLESATRDYVVFYNRSVAGVRVLSLADGTTRNYEWPPTPVKNNLLEISAITPDGRQLVVARKGDIAEQWSGYRYDLVTGARNGEFAVQADGALNFAPDGNLLLERKGGAVKKIPIERLGLPRIEIPGQP